MYNMEAGHPYYVLSNYTINRANEYELLIYPSDDPKFKLDIHDPESCELIMRVGKNGDSDYPFLLNCARLGLITLEFAEQEREKHHRQNENSIAYNIEGTYEWYEQKLLF